jgi:hypothetical protein
LKRNQTVYNTIPVNVSDNLEFTATNLHKL